MVNVGSHSYLFPTDAVNPTIGDSTYNTGGFAALLKIDDNMIVRDFFCIEDTLNNCGSVHESSWFPGTKMVLDQDHSGNLYITGLFQAPLIFGKDTLFPSGPPNGGIDAIFLAKLDKNLNPVWAVANDLHGNWMDPKIGVKEMEVDGRGRVWLTAEVDYLNSIAFGNDTIYGVGTVVFDTSSIPVPAYYNHPEISDYEFFQIKRVDEKRILLLKKDPTVFTDDIIMMDIDADTILWKKANYDDIRQVAVDTANSCYYGLTYNGVLYKYDMMGNRIWHNIYNLNAKPRFLAVTEDGGRVFVAAVNPDTMNTIYVIDNSGMLIDSTVWGTNTKFGNSYGMPFTSFGISSHFLKMTFSTNRLDTLLFSNDTLLLRTDPSTVISFMDIRGVLTSLPPISSAGEKTTAPLQLFPNPTNGFFRIKTQEQIEKIELYNNLGQYVRELQAKDDLLKIKEKPGIYFLQVRYKNGKAGFGKLVKQ